MTSSGPDVLTSCSTFYAGILQLNSEYLVGVGGPCSTAFFEWELLSEYTENDLDDLRQFGDSEYETVCAGHGLQAIGLLISIFAALNILV